MLSIDAFETPAKQSEEVPGEDDDRKSLHSEEDQYAEIDMEDNDEIKALRMEPIAEVPENSEDQSKPEAISPGTGKDSVTPEEQKATIHDSFDTFIVNDYFGEEDKCFDASINMTGIFAVRNSEIPSGKSVDATYDGNHTVDAIVANIESASKLTRTSKPIKVNDINQVMDNIDYVVNKSTVKNKDQDAEESNAPKKGTKAWESWWKKKKAVNGDLLNAAQIGDLEKVKSLLDKDEQKEFVANIKFQGLDNFTALHFAAQGGHYEICEFLIEKGCDVEALSNMGRTPLHLAAISGLNDILMLLIRNGADINSQDEDMYSALHHASEGGNTECVRILVEKGADVTLKNNIGSSPNDISQNIDVRSVIEQHLDHDEIVNDSLARRSALGGVILRNDRKNYVERLMGRFQKVDKYLKETKNGSEEALIESIEKQQRQREEDRKRERGMRQVRTEVDHKKKKKKEGRFEKNKDKFLQIVQLEMKMKEELRGFGAESDEAGPALFNPIGRLGRGSFGEVYLVEKLPEGTQYAMKILHKRRIMGQNLVRYARTERDVLSYFQHPFIVSINCAFQTPEKLYMILEYCPGGDLGSVLKREKKMSEERAKLYLAEIVLAIEALHKKDIIFRDLKPDNVVLDAEGHAMLTDFGLSKEGVTNNSSAKSFCGSVAYLAPEVLRRQGHGKSVDWYLVGVLLYEMLCGIPPYFSSNKDQMFKNIKSGPLRMPERFAKETKDFIIKLLNKNPSKRLGAGKKDAEELKSHAFFEGVNWSDVLERKQRMPKPVLREVKKSSVNLTDIVYGEYAGVGRVASSKEIEFQKALQKRGQTVKDTADADDLDRNKIPGWSLIET